MTAKETKFIQAEAEKPVRQRGSRDIKIELVILSQGKTEWKYEIRGPIATFEKPLHVTAWAFLSMLADNHVWAYSGSSIINFEHVNILYLKMRSPRSRRTVSYNSWESSV